MRNILKTVLEQFFGVQNYMELKTISGELVYLMEEQIEVICSKDYYDAKMNNDFSFQRVALSEKEVNPA